MAEGKILLILVIALLVLGPEKLPKLAADVGRWIGRARGMARQLQSQLDQEVHLNSILREPPRTTSAPPEPPVPPAAPSPSPSPPPATAAEPATVVDPYHSHAHGPNESHPDYAAGREAAAAALNPAPPAPPGPVMTETPQGAPEGNVRPLA